MVAWLPAGLGSMPVVEGGAAFEKLTRRHAVKLVPAVSCSVEEATLAVGEVVGCGSVKSASRMNGAIVIFLDSTAKVSDVVETGVVIQDTFTPVLPLVSPARKITISNAPPFIKNEMLAKELARYGQLVSPIKMVSLGCRSPLLKHVVCHRRQVFIVFKDKTDDLNLSFNFKVDGFNYMVFATSETMKCFGCGVEGHLIRSCPERSGEQRQAAAGGGVLAPAPAPAEEPRAPERDPAPAPAEEPRAPGRGPAPAPAEGPSLGGPPAGSAPPASSGGEEPVESSDQRQGKDEHQSSSENITTAADNQESEKVNDDLSVCEDFAEDEDMSDDDLLKLSQKRKSSEHVQSSAKAIKVTKGTKAGKSAAESESDFSVTQEDQQTRYSPADIKSFLQGTKGSRLVKVEDHFSDLKLFVESARPLTKKSGNFGDDVLTEQEIYRLKKLLLKVNAQITADDDDV